MFEAGSRAHLPGASPPHSSRRGVMARFSQIDDVVKPMRGPAAAAGVALIIIGILIRHALRPTNAPQDVLVFSLAPFKTVALQGGLNAASQQQQQPKSARSILRTSSPAQESVLIAKLPRGYRKLEPVPLAELVAFEVRRFRRNELRKATDSVVPLLEPERHRKRKSPTAQEEQLVEAAEMRPTRELSIETLARLHATEFGRSLDANNDAGAMAVAREVITMRPALLRTVIVDEERRLVLCAAPHAGDRTARHLLRVVAGLASADGAKVERERAVLDDDVDLFETLRTVQERKDGLVRLGEYSVRDRERILSDRNFKRIGVVRKPLTRAAATYLSGIMTTEFGSPEYRAFVGGVRGKRLEPNEKEVQKLSFSFYVMYLSRRVPAELQDVFLPQTLACGFDAIKYDHIELYDSPNFAQKLAAALQVQPSCNLSALEVETRDSQAAHAFTSVMDEAASRSAPRIAKLYALDGNVAALLGTAYSNLSTA